MKGQITWGLKRQATWVSPQANGKSSEKEWAWERRSERSDEICMWETYGWSVEKTWTWHWRQGQLWTPVQLSQWRMRKMWRVQQRLTEWNGCEPFTRGKKIELGDSSSVLGWETRETCQGCLLLWEEKHPSFDSCYDDLHLKCHPQTHALMTLLGGGCGTLRKWSLTAFYFLAHRCHTPLHLWMHLWIRAFPTVAGWSLLKPRAKISRSSLKLLCQVFQPLRYKSTWYNSMCTSSYCPLY